MAGEEINPHIVQYSTAQQGARVTAIHGLWMCVGLCSASAALTVHRFFICAYLIVIGCEEELYY